MDYRFLAVVTSKIKGSPMATRKPKITLDTIEISYGDELTSLITNFKRKLGVLKRPKAVRFAKFADYAEEQGFKIPENRAEVYAAIDRIYNRVYGLKYYPESPDRITR